MPRPSGVSQQEQQRGGGSNNDDNNDDEFIVNAVHGLSLGDAVRLKLVRVEGLSKKAYRYFFLSRACGFERQTNASECSHVNWNLGPHQTFLHFRSRRCGLSSPRLHRSRPLHDTASLEPKLGGSGGEWKSENLWIGSGRWLRYGPAQNRSRLRDNCRRTRGSFKAFYVDTYVVLQAGTPSHGNVLFSCRF